MTGKKVVVLGTGSSGIQVVQEAAKVAKEVTVLQRTPPNLALPMRQRQLTPPHDNDELRHDLPERFKIRSRAFAGFDFDFVPMNAVDLSEHERELMYERMWEAGGFELWLGNFQDILLDDAANRTFYDFWRSKVHERVSDPVKAEILAPKEPPHPLRCEASLAGAGLLRRVQPGQRQRGRLQQASDHRGHPPRASAPPRGGCTRPICSCWPPASTPTGGGIMAIDITGVDGAKLEEKWEHRVHTNFGLTSNGFPNMIFLYGPQSPAGFCNGPPPRRRSRARSWSTSWNT